MFVKFRWFSVVPARLGSRGGDEEIFNRPYGARSWCFLLPGDESPGYYRIAPVGRGITNMNDNTPLNPLSRGDLKVSLRDGVLNRFLISFGMTGIWVSSAVQGERKTGFLLPVQARDKLRSNDKDLGAKCVSG